MSVISVFNQKGGSGKTMLAVHLCVAAHLAGRKTLVLDADPQASAMAWRRARGDLPGPEVQVVKPGTLAATVKAARAMFDFILVDAPPSVSIDTRQIVDCADLVVIPVRPEPFDLAAVPATLKLVGSKPHVFVLSDCPPRAPEIDEVRELLQTYGVPVFGPVNNWRSMWRALVAGQAVAEFEPHGKPSQEIEVVCKAIIGELKNGK